MMHIPAYNQQAFHPHSTMPTYQQHVYNPTPNQPPTIMAPAAHPIHVTQQSPEAETPAPDRHEEVPQSNVSGSSMSIPDPRSSTRTQIAPHSTTESHILCSPLDPHSRLPTEEGDDKQTNCHQCAHRAPQLVQQMPMRPRIQPPLRRPTRTINENPSHTSAHIPLATTRRTHSTKFSRVFAFMIVLCFWGVFEGARRNGTIRLAQFNHFRGEKHNCLLPLPLSWCYACCVCCASCVFRSGASDFASGSLPTRSTRSAGAKHFTPIIPPPIFFFCHAFTRVLCHKPALVPNGTETRVFRRQLPSAYAFAMVLHCPRVLGVMCVVVFRF